jgi:non-ribosomal peptide synthetase component F
VCIDAYNHQELPFHLAARVVNGHERRPGATPLFQAAFTMDDDPATGVTAPGLRFGPVSDVPTGRVGLDLVLLVVNRPDELALTIDYSIRLFRPETVRSMLDDYVSILRRVTADPDVRVSALAAPEEVPLIDALCRLWADAFGVASIAPDQDFFEMGGSSLLAAQIVAGIGELIGAEVGLRTFFEAANIADLAERIGREHGVTAVPAGRVADIGRDSIEDLIGGIDDLSDDDVRAALGGRGSGGSPEVP